MKMLLSPLELSEKPATEDILVSPYDWQNQTRFSTLMAGKYTSGSVQTFDGQGKPKDNASDHND